MGLFDSPYALLPGCKPACWRGQSFFVPDVATEVGRRIVVTYFPGIDDPAIEDLGRGDGMIRVRGLIIGDDYVNQALAFMSALRSPGPGTFLHPWLGEQTVVVPPGGGVVSFSALELRMVRFEVMFQPVPARGAWGGLAALPLGSTLSRIFSAVSGVLWAARSFGAGALSGVLGAATWSAAVETALASGAALQAACAAVPSAPSFVPALAPQIVLLDAATALGAGDEAGDVIAAALVDLAAPLAGIAIGPPPSAIGPGPSAPAQVPATEYAGWQVSGTVPPVAPDDRAAVAPDPVASVRSPVLGPRAGAGLMLASSGEVAGLVAHGAPAEALRLVARCALIAHAVRTAAQVDYESRQDAALWRTTLDDALGATADDVGVMASASAVPAGEAARLWRSLGNLRGALAQDMHEVLGRLPSVSTITPVAPVSAWLLAQHFAGDDPTAVVPMFGDIARRNCLRHPAIVAGPVEVLTR